MIGLQIGFLWTMCVSGWLQASLERQGRSNDIITDIAIEVLRFVNWMALGLLLTFEYLRMGIVHLIIVELCRN